MPCTQSHAYDVCICRSDPPPPPSSIHHCHRQIALYLGRLSLPERPLGEYIDNWYDHLCEHELCMSKAYKMKVGMEQQTHTGVKKAGKV